VNWLGKLVRAGDVIVPMAQRIAGWVRQRREKPAHMPRPTEAERALQGWRAPDDD
jgi:hypothetical protein